MDETASRIAPAGFGRHAADRPTAAAVNPVPTRPTAAQRFHLLSRFAFGATPTELNWLSHYSAAAWWDNQVALGRQHAIYAAHRRVASAGPLLTKSPAQVRAAMKATGNEYAWDMMDQLTVVTLGLQAFSPAQLYETVVDFFANHLNVANHADDQTWVRHTMDRDVVRKFAFGTFSDMLVASARNPAMLRYLNLAESSKRLVNENYGRELLELHTVGLGAHYTETDVKNSAKLLTGRTVDGNGSYVYHPADHWTGAVKILGFSAANRNPGDGVAAGDAYLRYLASHPATAAHLAQKLCVRYVSDAPSAGLVASVAKAYLANHTAILPTIKAIFTSAEFWGSQRQKVRRPAENLIATLRILGVTLGPKTRSSLDMLRWMTMDMGNVPLDWAPPNGYPDVAAAWRSSSNLLSLWEYHRGFAQNWWKDLFLAPANTGLYGNPKPATSGAAIRAVAQHLTGTTLRAADLAALQTFLAEPASTPMARSNLRWYVDHLVPLILDGPFHAKR